MAGGGRLKGAAANAALVVAACAVGYLLIEVFFFRVLLVHWRPGLRTYLPETADILAQSSKREAVPRNYIAVLGDSYAQGLGDWMLEVGDDRSRPYHSVDVIHQELKRDVVSFGRSNGGSAETIVRQPTRILEGSKCFMFPDMAEPAGFVAYFYEGNDLRDNLLFLGRVNVAYSGTDTAQIDRYLADTYASFTSWRCHLHLTDIASHAVRNLYRALRFGHEFEQRQAKRINPIRLASGVTYGPYLEGPPPDMTEAQIADAVRVLDRSLAWLRRRYPGVPVTVAYLPGALSVYRFEQDRVGYYSRPMTGRREVVGDELLLATVERTSDFICRQIWGAAVANGAAFIDTRPALRAAASTQTIHGPRDWTHFNKPGYTVLGKLVAARLSAPVSAHDNACAETAAGR